MRVHCVTHVPFEGPGTIAEWASTRGHELVRIEAPRGVFPDPSEVGMLIVLGGPMSAGDVLRYPWMEAERSFLDRCVEAGVHALGICLGSQLLADVIGGSVRPGAQPEIGWYPVVLKPQALHSPYFSGWPETFVCGHWHNDAFDLPEDVEAVASSEVTPNQAFVTRGGRVVGLQFHLEWSREALRELTLAASEDLARPGRWVMSAEAMLEDTERFTANTALLFRLLDGMEELA
jgi:GMP synthase (glutamine-hydrolysing)